MTLLHPTLERPLAAWRELARRVGAFMPKGLYQRSLLIVIIPMVLLQSVIAYFFMERHWSLVTFRLSEAVTQDIAALVDLYESGPHDAATRERLVRVAFERMNLSVQVLPREPLPPALPKPFFSLVDTAMSNELRKQVARPFWIDTIGQSSLIEIRILLGDATFKVLARRNAAYASNSHIFLLWMMGTSLVLLGVAIAFLRNQIRPILRLAGAAQNFGKGRDLDFRPHGAREVRQAGYAFIEMRRRIERTIDQRTTMLNGVSHDLRTILTRFKLSLALMDGADAEAMQRDVEEMGRMLEAYLAFARGDAGEAASPTDLPSLIGELKADAERHGHPTATQFSGEASVTLRPDAFKRCLTNLVANATRHAHCLAITGVRDGRFLTVHVDDDGPGIPAHLRDEVFKPFVRLDEARNQDEGGSGLGLAIARDIARSHGGDILLAEAPLGGLRASVRVPV